MGPSPLTQKTRGHRPCTRLVALGWIHPGALPWELGCHQGHGKGSGAGYGAEGSPPIVLQDPLGRCGAAGWAGTLCADAPGGGCSCVSSGSGRRG